MVTPSPAPGENPSDPNAAFCSHVAGVFPDALRLPYVEGVPNVQKVKTLQAWLKSHSDRYKNESVVLYHATGIRIPIASQGLKPTSATRRRSYQSTPGYVYLAATPERAKNFGDLGNQSQSRVYAVSVLLRHLKADLDQLVNQRSTGQDIGNSLAESILFGGGARVKGAIPMWNVREVHAGPDGKFKVGSNPRFDAMMFDEVAAKRDRALDFVKSAESSTAKKSRKPSATA